MKELQTSPLPGPLPTATPPIWLRGFAPPQLGPPHAADSGTAAANAGPHARGRLRTPALSAPEPSRGGTEARPLTAAGTAP